MADSPLQKTCQGYGSVSSISGVLYVFDTSYSNLSRAFWFIIGILLIIMSAMLIQQSYSDWQDNLVITTINTTGYPIRNVEFPAITICGQGLVQSVMEDILLRQVYEYLVTTEEFMSNDLIQLLTEYNYTHDFVKSFLFYVNKNFLPNYSSEVNATYQTWKNLTSDFRAFWRNFTKNYNGDDFIELLKNTDKKNEFMAYKYPGIDDPHVLDFIIKGFTIPEGDFNTILTQNQAPNVQPTNRCLNDSSTSENVTTTNQTSTVNITQLCGSNDYAYDNIGKYCYRLAAGTANANLINARFICEADENGFDIIDDQQLETLAKLMGNKSAPLSALSNGTAFWTSTMINTVFPNGFLFPAHSSANLNNGSSPFNNIAVKESNSNESCFSLTYNNTSGKFDGQISGCDQSLRVICYKQTCLTQDPLPIFSYYTWSLQAAKSTELNKYYRSILKNLDDKLYDSILEVMWYSKLPCFYTNIVSRKEPFMGWYCTWKGNYIPCHKIFSPFPTDNGMCCTFNMEAADKMFKEGKFEKMINKMKNMDENLAESDYFGVDPHMINEPMSEAGTDNGLIIYLDAHSDLISRYEDDFQGFTAIVGAPNEYLQLKKKKIFIKPGHVNLVGISATVIQSNEDIRSLATNKRACYFPDEFTDKLYLHKNYTQANCMLECRMRYASNATLYSAKHQLFDSLPNADDIAPCTPWFLPNNNDARICSPWEVTIYTSQKVPGGICDYCLPDCTFTKYDTQVTALPFHKCEVNSASEICSQIANAKLTNRTIDNEIYDPSEMDIALVQFYMESPTVIQFTRDLKMTWVDFLGLIGGFVGLCNGFSVCSAVEIFFWFTAMWWKFSQEYKQEKQNKSVTSLRITKVEPIH